MMKRTLSFWPLFMVLSMLAFGCYWMTQSFNPNSQWCVYQIYRTTNGTYEVWWHGISTDREWSGTSLEEARAYQSNACQRLIEFMSQRPKGERVK